METQLNELADKGLVKILIYLAEEIYNINISGYTLDYYKDFNFEGCGHNLYYRLKEVPKKLLLYLQYFYYIEFLRVDKFINNFEKFVFITANNFGIADEAIVKKIVKFFTDMDILV